MQSLMKRYKGQNVNTVNHKECLRNCYAHAPLHSSMSTFVPALRRARRTAMEYTQGAMKRTILGLQIIHVGFEGFSQALFTWKKVMKILHTLLPSKVQRGYGWCWDE